jgi:hypothetical protein
MSDRLAAAELKMRKSGLDDSAIATFRYLYGQLVLGDNGLLADAELSPVDSLLDLSELPALEATNDLTALDRTAVIS